MPIAVLGQGLREFLQGFGVDPLLVEGDFFGAGDHQALAFLQGGNEASGLQQAVVRTGVEPGVAPAHDFNVELVLLKIAFVDVGDFQLATVRRFDVGCNVADLLVVEIQTRDGVVAFGLGGLFFDAQGALVGVKVDHAIALGVVNVVGKHAGTAGALVGAGQQFDEVVAVENVVAQHQGARVVAHKLFANDEGLRQPVRAGLHRVLNVHAPLAAVTQQFGKAWGVLRGADEQHIANARQHQRGERVIHHGLVVHRHELLAHGLGDGVQPGAGASGEDDAFALIHAALPAYCLLTQSL